MLKRVVVAVASAFVVVVPAPSTTRLKAQQDWWPFGSKEEVKEPETVTDTGTLPTDIKAASASLDGTRKAFALFNSGIISRSEIAATAVEFTRAEADKQAKAQAAETEKARKAKEREDQVASAY